MIRGESEFGEKVSAEYRLPDVGNRKIEVERTRVDCYRFVNSTEAVNWSAIGCAEFDPVGSGNPMFGGRRYDGEESAPIDEVTLLFIRVPNVKKIPIEAGRGVHVRRPA